ncbi:glycosyltransferase family 4 protein [Pedobacter aquatilis]|uniref:glycosyltransferase family 4 protein n=1 Tax=Pedobacter aquatilis TaxID=351343 RepID=UPI00292FD4B5|nr:glycosyltransferase family 4 protein [Pedobacter aquatilis]
MKILLITKRIPFPPNSGYPIVVYNTMKGLLQLGADITLFSLNPLNVRIDLEDISDPVFEQVKTYSQDIDTGVNMWSAFFNIFTNESYNVSRYFTEDAARQLENLLRENTFDIIQFEGLFVVPYLDVVKANSSAKLIYRAHNIEFTMWERLSYSESFLIRRKYLAFLAQRLKAYETEQINRFHHIFAISEPDRQSIIKFGCEIPMTVFPVAIDLTRYKVDKSKTSFPTLFHLGAMDWRPNQEGLEWFLDDIWPDIEKLNKDLRFYIAGKNMQKHFFEYDSDNLIVEGEVFDAVEFMNSKAIMIVPLISGTGMRVKIIEGMAMKKCIIATTTAAEGINCRHGHDILIADTADEFYRSILQCIINPKRWMEIGENARNTVEKDHAVDLVAGNMLKIYETLAAV